MYVSGNTSRMSFGAACGPGIYLARNSQTSFGYVLPTMSWPKSLFGGGQLSAICMAEGACDMTVLYIYLFIYLFIYILVYVSMFLDVLLLNLSLVWYLAYATVQLSLRRNMIKEVDKFGLYRTKIMWTHAISFCTRIGRAVYHLMLLQCIRQVRIISRKRQHNRWREKDGELWAP